jgi:hypothetical protein
LTAGEVMQALARAPFDTPVLVRWPQADARFNIARVELTTEGQDRWEIVIEPNMNVTEPV